MISQLDRYVLRELLPPFLLAVTIFLIYIFLTLILAFSDFMLDQNIPWSDLLRALVYRVPELLVFGLPIGVLFAVFLGLGRLNADQELIALQAGGTSLRRVIMPVVAFGLLVSIFTFVINDQVVPWSARQYQTLFRQLIVRGSVPQIQDNTIFKDATNRFFYVKRYDRNSKVMHDVLVYDPNGQTYLSELQSPYPQMITAKEARWEEGNWILYDGTAHQFEAEGALAYLLRFETLTILVGDTLENLFIEQRSPREMSLSELAQRIETFRTAGQPVADLVVEYQTKLVVPLSALMFALFAAPMSLSFGFRGRAAGIIVGVLLTIGFEVAFFVTQILSRRELLSPAWGPWLPNLCFGVLGIVLIFNVDRLSRLELSRWFYRTSVLILIPLLSVSGYAAEEGTIPLDVRANALEISQDGKSLLAQGDVRAHYGEQSLLAQELRLERVGTDRWRLSATGEVVVEDPSFAGVAQALEVLLQQDQDALIPTHITLHEFVVNTQGELGKMRFEANRGTIRFSDALDTVLLEGQAVVVMGESTLRADELVLQRQDATHWQLAATGGVRFESAAQTARAKALRLELRVVEDNMEIQSATLDDFSGAGTFKNAAGEEHRLRYAGETGRFSFAGGALTRMELERAQFTTCTCAETIEKASYSLSGRHITLWPGEWILGREITLRTSGFPVFWVPLFFTPLKDFTQNPLFPEFGQDAQRGWFARWRLPLFLDTGDHGIFSLDYYHRQLEIGLGLDWNYALKTQSQSGRIHTYHLGGPNETLDWSWSHRWAISQLANLSWSLLRRDANSQETSASRWAYNVNLSGETSGWQWQLHSAREQIEQKTETGQDEKPQPQFRVLERLPEVNLSHAASLGNTPLRYGGSMSWGRFREQRGTGEPFTQRDRLDSGANLSGSINVQSASLRFSANTNVRFSLYGEDLLRSSADTRRISVQSQVDARWAPWDAFSVSARYLFQSVQGKSPFAFDSLSVAERVTGQMDFSVLGIVGNLSSAYSFRNQQLDALTLNLTKTLGEHTLHVTATTIPNLPLLESLRVQERWAAPWGALTLAGGYLVPTGQLEDLIVKLNVGKDLRLGTRIDLNRGFIRRTNAEFELALGAWTLDFHGEYDWPSQRFSALQVGLVHHFCHDCWQAGVYLSGERIWLQVQINAFPGSGIQYSPTDGDLSFN